MTARPLIPTDGARHDGLVAGVDLGGTKVQLSLVEPDGTVAHSLRLATDAARGPDGVIGSITDGVRELTRQAGTRAVIGVGVGVAGQVDRTQGIVRFAPNLPGWRDVPLCDRLSGALGMPVRVLNDVQAATVGDWAYGAGRGARDLVCLFVGTGVGGGAVVAGRLASGAAGSAGEFGHTTIALGGRRCRCGNYGCVEAYAGGWAIAERAESIAVSGDPRADELVRLAGDIHDITARTVAQAATAGDPLAREILEDVVRALGACAVSIVNAINPSVLILGGGVVEGVPTLVGAVEDHVRRHALPSAAKAVALRAAALHNDAGVVGAAAWMRWPHGVPDELPQDVVVTAEHPAQRS